jgi:hypothetical protein
MSLPDESNEKLSKMATEKREGRGGKEMIKIHELLYTLDTLKHLKRTGWVHFDVPEPETVAGHM